MEHASRPEHPAYLYSSKPQGLGSMERELIRPVMSVEKLAKAEAVFLRMVETLSASNSIALHREVDLSYYQQKVAELSLLRMQLQEAHEAVQRVEERAGQHYRMAYTVWRRDMLWLRSALAESI